MLAITMAALVATSAPNTTWLGVTIGETMSQVRADLGDPLNEAETGDGTMSLYYTAHNTAYLAVVERRGFVATITLDATAADPRIPADPHGVKIGATDPQVRALRGNPGMIDNSEGVHRLLYFGKTMWSYVFRNGAVGQIIDGGKIPSGTSPVPTADTGASFNDAIVVKGENAKTLPGWESTYLSLNPCSGGAKRRVVKRESIYNVEGVAYDMITTTCAGKSTPETLYFDVSADGVAAP